MSYRLPPFDPLPLPPQFASGRYDAPRSPAANARAALAYIRARYGAAASGSLPGVAIAVGPGAPVKLRENVLSPLELTVRNDGPDPVTISKDPGVVAGGGLQVASGVEESVSLAPGETVYAITAALKAASLEII